MATAAASFHALWHPGVRVQELAAPHRKGTIFAVKGTGINAAILVRLDGHGPATFTPASLRII